MKLPIALIALISSSVFAQTALIPLERPLAMDRLQQPPSDLFALTPSKVFALHDDGSALKVVGSFALPSSDSPSDLVLAIIKGNPRILVSGSRAALGGGYVSLYSTSGQLLRTWRSQRPLCGMDYDGWNIIYVASCNTNEIYQADLQGKDDFSFVAEISGARHLGPAIVDSVRGQLIVGEIDSGELYSIDLKSRRSHLLARGFGSPQAFTFSADLKQVFVADSSRRVVYRLNLTVASPSPSVFAESPQFKEPDGLALLSSGRVAVADDRSNGIFVVPAMGQAKSK